MYGWREGCGTRGKGVMGEGRWRRVWIEGEECGMGKKGRDEMKEKGVKTVGRG